MQPWKTFLRKVSLDKTYCKKSSKKYSTLLRQWNILLNLLTSGWTGWFILSQAVQYIKFCYAAFLLQYTEITIAWQISPKVVIFSTWHLTDGRFEDCNIAAGMENRQITDRQVTASSFASGHHPSRGRLNNEIEHVNGTVLLGSWCAATQDTSQYIQV